MVVADDAHNTPVGAKESSVTASEILLIAAETCQRDMLLALADEAEEGGDLVLALGYRWLARHGKWPIERRGADGVCWYWACSAQEGFSDSHELPQSVWARYPSASGPLTFEGILSWAAQKVGEIFGDDC